MKREKEYSSAVRSRQMIRDAFFELLLEKECQKITVTDIARRAGINRSTFYAHYPDVRGLMQALEKDSEEKCSSVIAGFTVEELCKNPFTALEKVNEMVMAQEKIYRIMGKAGCSDWFSQQAQRSLFGGVLPSYLAAEENEKKVLAAAFFFLCGGMENLYQKWFRGEFDCSLEELAGFMKQALELIGEGIKKEKE